MASRETITITLAGQGYAIRPLTLGQVETIDAIVAGPSTGAVAQGVAIVAVGLARDHAGVTTAALRDMEVTGPELAAAMQAVLRQGGFLPGEALAAAPKDAPTGAPSAAA